MGPGCARTAGHRGHRTRLSGPRPHRSRHRAGHPGPGGLRRRAARLPDPQHALRPALDVPVPRARRRTDGHRLLLLGGRLGLPVGGGPLRGDHVGHAAHPPRLPPPPVDGGVPGLVLPPPSRRGAPHRPHRPPIDVGGRRGREGRPGGGPPGDRGRPRRRPRGRDHRAHRQPPPGAHLRVVDGRAGLPGDPPGPDRPGRLLGRRARDGPRGHRRGHRPHHRAGRHLRPARGPAPLPAQRGGAPHGPLLPQRLSLLRQVAGQRRPDRQVPPAASSRRRWRSLCAAARSTPDESWCPCCWPR